MGIVSLVERLTDNVLKARGVKSRSADTSLAKVHFYDAPGRGPLPTIVLLHGIGSSAAAYGLLLHHLRNKARRVLAPDAPGHGKSGEPKQPLTPESLFSSLSEVLDQELDEPAIVFGCSLGGAVAIHYALARPDRVRGLVLASPAGAAMAAEDLKAFLKTFNLSSRGSAHNFMARLRHKAPWYTPLIASDLMEVFGRPVISSFTSSVRPDHMFTTEQIAGLRMPIHLIWGRSDRLMPESHLVFYKKSLPAHAIIEEPDNIGHCPHLDAPLALADKIARFARNTLGSNPARH